MRAAADRGAEAHSLFASSEKRQGQQSQRVHRARAAHVRCCVDGLVPGGTATRRRHWRTAVGGLGRKIHIGVGHLRAAGSGRRAEARRECGGGRRGRRRPAAAAPRTRPAAAAARTRRRRAVATTASLARTSIGKMMGCHWCSQVHSHINHAQNQMTMLLVQVICASSFVSRLPRNAK